MSAAYNSKDKIPSLELTYLQNGRAQFWVSAFAFTGLIMALGFLSKAVVSVAGDRLEPPEYSYLWLMAVPCAWKINAFFSKINLSTKVTLPQVIEFNSFCGLLDIDVEYALYKIRQVKLNIFISQHPLSQGSHVNVSVRNIFLFHQSNYLHSTEFIEKVRCHQICLDYRQALPLIENHEKNVKQKEEAAVKSLKDENDLLKKAMAASLYENSNLKNDLAASMHENCNLKNDLAASIHENDNLKKEARDRQRTIKELVARNDAIDEAKMTLQEAIDDLGDKIKASRSSSKTQIDSKTLLALIVGYHCMPTIEDIFVGRVDKCILFSHELNEIFVDAITQNSFTLKLCRLYMEKKMKAYDRYIDSYKKADLEGTLEFQQEHGLLKKPLVIPWPIKNELWKIAQELGIAARPGHP